MFVMKSFFLKSSKAGLAALSGFVFALSSCSKEITGVETIDFYQTDDGAVEVDTFRAVVKVTAINPKTRKLALVTSDGKTRRVTCGPEVRNFDQIEVGDLIEIVQVEEFAIFLGNEKPSGGGESTTKLARLGGKPGTTSVETVSTTALIKKIDTAKRKVTLELPDKTQRVVKVDPSIDLSKPKVGQSVTVEHTEALAISVRSPE